MKGYYKAHIFVSTVIFGGDNIKKSTADCENDYRNQAGLKKYNNVYLYNLR